MKLFDLCHQTADLRPKDTKVIPPIPEMMLEEWNLLVCVERENNRLHTDKFAFRKRETYASIDNHSSVGADRAPAAEQFLQENHPKRCDRL